MRAKTKIEALVELLEGARFNAWCESFEGENYCNGLPCDVCPFNSEESLKETFGALKDVLNKGEDNG